MLEPAVGIRSHALNCIDIDVCMRTCDLDGARGCSAPRDRYRSEGRGRNKALACDLFLKIYSSRAWHGPRARITSRELATASALSNSHEKKRSSPLRQFRFIRIQNSKHIY